MNSEYTDRVALEVLLPEDEIKPVTAEITEGTNEINLYYAAKTYNYTVTI